MAHSSLVRASVLVIGVTALLAGCVTPVPPVTATRFHRIDQTVTASPGLYDIRAPETGILADRPDPSYAAAVSRQLDTLGYRSVLTIAAGEPDYFVDLSVGRTAREVREGSPVNVGVGGNLGSYGSGVGVGVGVNLGSLFGSGNADMVTTRLMVRITRRGDDQPLWEGRAETMARDGTPAAQPGIAAGKLAAALFQGFPGRSGETISVP